MAKEIDVILEYVKSLDKKIDDFKKDAHDLLKGSMERIEETLKKIVDTLNVHDDDIRELKTKVECIENEKKQRKEEIKELKKNTFQIFLEILRGWIFPIAVILTLIWFKLK